MDISKRKIGSPLQVSGKNSDPFYFRWKPSPYKKISNTIATTGIDGTIAFWEATTGKNKNSIKLKYDLLSMDFDRNGIGLIFKQRGKICSGRKGSCN